MGDQAARGRDPAAVAGAQLQADRDAEEQSDRLLHRLLRHRHRLCDDLAHLVDGGRRAVRRLCGLRRGSPGATRRNTKFRRKRSRGSTAPAAQAREEWLEQHVRAGEPRMSDRHCPPASAPGRSASSAGWPSRPRVAAADVISNRPWRKRAGLQAHHRGLWLLDLPAQRHRHVLLLLRGLCRAADGDGRRPVRARSVRSRRVAFETACLLLPRATPAACPPSPPRPRSLLWTQICLLVTGAARPRLPRFWNRRSSPRWSPRASGLSAAPCSPPSSPWWAAMVFMSPPGCSGSAP